MKPLPSYERIREDACPTRGTSEAVDVSEARVQACSFIVWTLVQMKVPHVQIGKVTMFVVPTAAAIEWHATDVVAEQQHSHAVVPHLRSQYEDEYIYDY